MSLEKSADKAASRKTLSPMLVALAAMFGQQTFASVGKTLPAIVAPLVLAELGADAAWVGIYFGLAAAASLIAQMGCGSFIIRHGALRMSQVALVLLGGGMAAAAEGGLLGFGASAAIGGGGAAISTPTSSQLLGRVSPPRLAPLVFSIKQTAVPAGLLLAGFLGPAMAAAWGWRGAMLATGAACLAGAVVLQPLRARFDDDRVASRRFRLSDFRATIASVVTTPDLRNLSFACFAFNGIQSVFTAYFVTYLVALGYDLAAAGSLFSIVVALAVPCRVLWGWLGSFHVAPRLVMAGLALGMAAWRRGDRSLRRGMADPGDRAGRRNRQRHRGLLARHPAVRDRAARAGRSGRRGDRRGPVVRSDRRAVRAVRVLAAALYDRRLRRGLGGLRDPGAVGRHHPAAGAQGAGFLPGRPAAIRQQ